MESWAFPEKLWYLGTSQVLAKQFRSKGHILKDTVVIFFRHTKKNKQQRESNPLQYCTHIKIYSHPIENVVFFYLTQNHHTFCQNALEIMWELLEWLVLISRDEQAQRCFHTQLFSAKPSEVTDYQKDSQN